MKSWKTTVSGIGVILAGIGNAITEYMAGGVGAINFAVLFAAITSGFGLIAARDNNVSSEQAGIKK